MHSDDAALPAIALQQPAWPDAGHLRDVCRRLAGEAAPVDIWSSRALRDELAQAAAGDGFVLIGGDCAEMFDDSTPARVVQKAEHLHGVADRLERATGTPTTRIGRLGGQFAKPRSHSHELLGDGRRVPSYRGDAVNGLAADARRPDPERLLVAHRCTRTAVAALLAEDRRLRRPRTFLAHEALLLDYERALLRHDGRHASSAHFLWIGDRTRHPDQAHVAFAAAIENGVGVKLGPAIEPAHARALTTLLDPGHERRPGRLSLIVRMGASRCARLLPPVIDALGSRADDVLWILDPMHGNGRTNVHGQKTRLVTDIAQEIRAFFDVLSRRDLRPAGIHLELTPDDVTECIDGEADLIRFLPSYESACDPRLNPDQTAEVVDLVADLLCARPSSSASPRKGRQL